MKGINVKLSFKLKAEDKKKVNSLMQKGKEFVRIIKRARMLELFDEKYTSPQIARFVGVTPETVRRIGWNYVHHGLDRALYDLPHPGTKKKITDKERTHIIALVCTDPPEGYDRWSIRLLTEEVLKCKIVKKISRETIRIILKSHRIKPWREKMWCIPELNDEYIERMEDILNLYTRVYYKKEPVICLDEKPIQLLEDIRKPRISNGKGFKIKKRDHQYKRKGTANVFSCIEPLAGHYHFTVTKNKKGPEFAKVMNKLSRKYHKADVIHIVMDNYCTHTQKALVDYYGEEKGNMIWNQFEVHYTPKNASWLDQAEIAIGLYSKQCLGKERIPDIDILRNKTKAWIKAINKKKVKLHWGFTVEKARKIFDYDK